MRGTDISCDLGEAASTEERETELALWPLVDAANVACGGHAGDDASMREASALARRYGLSLGAHPSFPDREGFGRRPIAIASEELVASLAMQIGRLHSIASAEGIALVRVKAHGALYNLAHRDAELARLLACAVARATPDAAIVCPAGSAMEAGALQQGLAVLREAFADRRYLADGTLVPRSDARALLENPAEASSQAVRLATHGSVIAIDGREVAVPHDTICIHSDMPRSVERLRAIRTALAAAGVALNR